MQYGESTDAVDRVRIPAEAVRREYGAVRTDLSAAYVKHEITFKIGRRIGVEIHRHSTHTVRIPRGSRRIEHPPRSAASVRRCERGITQYVGYPRSQLVSSEAVRVFCEPNLLCPAHISSLHFLQICSVFLGGCYLASPSSVRAFAVQSPSHAASVCRSLPMRPG